MPIRRVSAAVPEAATARRASLQPWRRLRAWTSNFSPSVERSVPARDRVNSRAPTEASSACTRAEIVDWVTCNRSAVR